MRPGWLTFSAVVLITAGIMRVLDAIWALRYHGALPNSLKDATLGHSLTTYGWLWLITGTILAIFLMPYYPVYIAIAIMVIYGLSAHFGQEAT